VAGGDEGVGGFDRYRRTKRKRKRKRKRKSEERRGHLSIDIPGLDPGTHAGSSGSRPAAPLPTSPER
jgi:hypothetical protein